MSKKHLATVVLLAMLADTCQSTAKEFTQNGVAMEPTIKDRQVVESSLLSAFFYAPSRWDIVLYRNPSGELNALLGRIIGMPDEEIEVTEKGLVVNGKKLKLPSDLVRSGIKYLPASQVMPGAKDRVYRTGEAEYFILGDNSANSFDSRFFGPVHRNNVMNKIKASETHNE